MTLHKCLVLVIFIYLFIDTAWITLWLTAGIVRERLEFKSQAAMS